MISPEERNAATVGALLSLSPPRGAGVKAQGRGRGIGGDDGTGDMAAL